jgi:hypothetical protein
VKKLVPILGSRVRVRRIVSVQNENGEWIDITEKTAMESAIMAENITKYQQSFHTPFMTAPLVTEFGYL